MRSVLLASTAVFIVACSADAPPQDAAVETQDDAVAASDPILDGITLSTDRLSAPVETGQDNLTLSLPEEASSDTEQEISLSLETPQ